MAKKSVIGLGIALAVLAGCFLLVMAGGMDGGIIGHLAGRRAARVAFPRLWLDFGAPRGPWEEGPWQWPQPSEPRELPPEEMLESLAWELSAALITDVEPGAPADEAGVEVEDIIIAVDGRVMSERDDLSRFIRRYEPEDEVVLTILRRRDEIELIEMELTLGRQRDEEGRVIARLGVWYRPLRIGVHIMPGGEGPRD